LLTLNGGHKFPKNSVNVTIEGSAISDDAGNLLEGTFSGAFPSSGQPGSNFSATVSITSPPVPTPKGPALKAQSVAQPTTASPIRALSVRPRQAIVVASKVGK
jgi:hypothetical protein